MPKHQILVTRDATITYMAEVDLTVEQIEARCGKNGFKDEGLPPMTWHKIAESSYDNVERYEIRDPSVDEGDSGDENIVVGWDMQ